jgi:hypothetical protein
MMRSFGILLLVAALLGSVSAQTAVGIDLAGASFYSSSGATMTQVPHSPPFSLAVITSTPPTLSIRSWRDPKSSAGHTLTIINARNQVSLGAGQPSTVALRVNVPVTTGNVWYVPVSWPSALGRMLTLTRQR